MRVAPMYQSGSIGFTVSGGIPKVGQLLNSAWNLTDKCRFKVKKIFNIDIKYKKLCKSNFYVYIYIYIGFTWPTSG